MPSSPHVDDDPVTQLGLLLFSESGTLSVDRIHSDSAFQSRLAALLNGPAVPAEHLASLLSSLLLLPHTLRSACTQMFAMDWFSFVARSACLRASPTQDGANNTWSTAEHAALAFVRKTMLQDDGVSPREVLLAVQQRLLQVRAEYVDLLDAGEVGYESASDQDDDDDNDDEDEAQGKEHDDMDQNAPVPPPLDRQAVFTLLCGLHAFYLALVSPTPKKRTKSLLSDLVSAWLPLRTLTSNPDTARLFLSSTTPIFTHLLTADDVDTRAFALRLLGHFLGLLDPSDPLVVSHLPALDLVTPLLPAVSIEDHVLVALVLPTGVPELTAPHFPALLATVRSLLKSPQPRHWRLAHGLLAYLGTLPAAAPAAQGPEADLGDFFAHAWLPFLCATCPDPGMRARVLRAGDHVLTTHVPEVDLQVHLLLGLVATCLHANGKCMVLGSLVQPRMARAGVGEVQVGGLVQRDVLALMDALAAAGAEGVEGQGKEEVAGLWMVVLAWVQLAYVLVKVGQGHEALRGVLVDPLGRLEERGLVPPVVAFALHGLREAIEAGGDRS